MLLFSLVSLAYIIDFIVNGLAYIFSLLSNAWYQVTFSVSGPSNYILTALVWLLCLFNFDIVVILLFELLVCLLIDRFWLCCHSIVWYCIGPSLGIFSCLGVLACTSGFRNVLFVTKPCYYIWILVLVIHNYNTDFSLSVSDFFQEIFLWILCSLSWDEFELYYHTNFYWLHDGVLHKWKKLFVCYLNEINF